MTTTPPTTQAIRNVEANGGTCSDQRHERPHVSPKPKRDGTTRNRIASPQHSQGGAIRKERPTQAGMTEGGKMAAKHKVTVSTRPTNPRGTTAERRAAQVASLSTRQAELKQEAAERRAARAKQSAPTAPMPRKPAAARRSNSR
jgi:hypothetical protein